MKNKNNKFYILFALIPIFIVIIVIAIPLISNSIEKNKDSGNIDSNQSSTITQLTKKKPTIAAEQTLTDIVIKINANDNYEEVQIKLNLYDDNQTLINTYTLQGQNYKKNNTYTLNKTLTIKEHLSVREFTYELIYYK